MANSTSLSTQSGGPSRLAPFSPKAKAFFTRPPAKDKFFTLLEGSVRSGKTWAMMVKILALCKYRVAGQRVLIGNSKESIRRNVLTDLASFVGRRNFRLNMNSGQLWLYGVEWLVIGVSNEGSERAIRGMTAGIIVWDEVTQAPKNVFDMAISRLSPEGSRFYGTTNPDNPYHYLLTDYLENEKFKPYVTRIPFFLDDNYSISAEKRQQIRDTYTGVFFLRFILGKWVMAEGAIYKDALAETNYYTDETVPIGLRGQGGYIDRLVPIDYGTANQTVFLDILDDGTTYWVDDEYVWDSRVENRQKTDAEYGQDLEDWLAGKIKGREVIQPKRGAQVIIDPSAASFKVELLQRGIYHRDAVNDVLDGIRTVSSLLAQRKLKLNRDRCPNLIKQLESYAWDEKAAKHGEEKPLKVADHACFVAGTMIETPSGKKAVECLAVGDEISTPLGICKVLATNPREAECVTAYGLTGTPEHPVFIGNKWSRLDALSYNYICASNPSYTVELRSGDTPILITSPTETTSGPTRDTSKMGLLAFIGKYGRMLTGRYRTSITSTTRTATPATTNCPTFNVCPALITYPAIALARGAAKSTWLPFKKWQNRGTDQMRGELGIVNMRSGSWQGSRTEESSPSYASIAGRRSRRGLWGQALAIALTLASRMPGANRVWTMLPELARAAAAFIWQTSTPKARPVAANVPSKLGSRVVYALRTEHGCYIANGVLVSNCDSLRYGMQTAVPDWRVAA